MNKANTWERGDLVHLSNCPACHASSNASKLLFERQDDDKLLSDQWSIYCCTNCTSTYINPRPAESSLPALYEEYLTHNASEPEAIDTSNALTWKLIRGYLQRRFNLTFSKTSLSIGYFIFLFLPPFKHKLDRYGRNMKLKSFPNKGKLLDLGCGAGEFLSISSRMGWKAYGCDFDPVVVSSCRSLGFDVRQGGLETFLNEETFDAITMNQVIEHVIAPQQVIKDCYSKLNSGGCLWIGTPNPNSMGAKIFGKAWAGWHPPYHLCLPSQQELIRWLNDAGFSCIQVLQRGPHAAFNWRTSKKLMMQYGLEESGGYRLWMHYSNVMSCFSPKRGEESVVIGFKE